MLFVTLANTFYELFHFSKIIAVWPRVIMITSGQSNSTKRPHCCGTGRDGAVMFVRLRLCAPHLIHASLDSLQSTSQTASRLHQPFLANVRYAVARPSVCLSSVTLMHPTQAVVIFGNCSTVFGTLAILGH